MRALAIIVLATGCGGSPKPSSSSPPADPGQPTLVDPPAGGAKPVACGPAVQHVLEKMTPGGADAKMVEVGIKLCTDDAWSAQARSCMATALSRSQGQGCIDHELNNEQRKHFGEALLAAFGNK